MSLAGLLGRLGAIFEGAGVPFMVTGSLASTLYGEPRSTVDVDIVVVLNGVSLPRLLAALPEDQYYVSEDSALDAIRGQGQFNIIDMETGWKIDLILRKRRPFSAVEFERRERRAVLGVHLPVCTAEDSVLSKLEWAKKGGGSERQIRDVAGIVALQGDALDRAYIARWVGELGVADLWDAVNGQG